MSLAGFSEAMQNAKDPVPPGAAIALLRAIEAGDQDAIQSLESKISRIAATPCDPDGAQRIRTPLLAAAEAGNAYVLSRVREEDAQNARDGFGLDALMIAAKHGHADAVGALLLHGLNPKATHGSSHVLGFKSGGMTALKFAAEGGHADCVNALLAAGSSPDARGPKERTPYMMAAAAGSAACMKLLFTPKQLRLVDERGETAIMIAAKAGASAALDNLVKLAANNPDIDKALRAPDREGITPLMMAAHLGHAECVEILAGRGGVNLASKKGFTPLMFAAKEGHTDAVLALLRAQANTEATDHTRGLTASGHAGSSLAHGSIRLSSIIDSVASVRALTGPASKPRPRALSNDFEAFLGATRAGLGGRAIDYYDAYKAMAKPEDASFRTARDAEGNTALMVAAFSGNLAVLDMLLADTPKMPIERMGADGREFTFPGEPVAEVAKRLAQKERWAAIPANAPLDIDARDTRGDTALMRAASGGHPDCIASLLVAGADPAAVNLDGWNALMLAASHGHSRCAALLAARASTATASHDGLTALMIAAHAGQDSCARLLANADSCAQADPKGNTALIFAAAQGRAECARILAPLSDPGAVNHKKASALYCAASAGHKACVSILASHNDPDARSIDGFTPLMAAALGGHEECAKVLLGAGDPRMRSGRGQSRAGKALEEGVDAEEFARRMGHAALADLIALAKKERDERQLLAAKPDADGPARLSEEGARRAALARGQLSAMAALAKERALALLKDAPSRKRARSARRRA